MKNKTWFIVLIILVILFIGWSVLFKHSQVQAPIAPAATTSTGTSSDNAPASTRTASTPAVIYLSGGAHPTTTILTVGQKVMVTIADPISAGYQIDPIQYDSSIVGVANHSHSTAGVNGTDSWEFVALRSGTTGVTITATQGTNKAGSIQLFTNVMSVK